MSDITYYVARNKYGIPECPLKGYKRCQLDPNVKCPEYEDEWCYPNECPLRHGKVIIIRED